MTLRKWLIGTILLTALIDARRFFPPKPPRPSCRAGESACGGDDSNRRVASVAAVPLDSGIDQAGFDKSVRPQDDLFRAVNGAVDRQDRDSRRPSDYGVFGILADNAEKDLREIIESCAAAKDNPPGSERQKVGDLYASFMDEARVEELGIRPIAARLAAVDAVRQGRPGSHRWPNCRGSACPAPWHAMSMPTPSNRTGTSSRSARRGWACPTATITSTPNSRLNWPPIRLMSSGC